MFKVFKLQYENYLNNFIIKSERGKDLNKIFNFYRKYFPKDGDIILLKKFPDFDLKTITKIECSIDNISSDKEIEKIIWSSKKLRKFLKINEKSVCFNCSKKDKCKFFEMIPEEKDNASINDLQNVIHGFYTFTTPQNIEFNQKQIGSIDSGLTPNNNEEIFINKTSDNSLINLNRIKNKQWNSLSTIMGVFKEITEDLIFNNGIMFKTILNAYLETKKEEEKIEILKIQQAKELEKKTDPIVKLVEELKNCKNRKEKRRLLAQFNKKVGFGLGEYRTIIPDHNAESYDDSSNNTNSKFIKPRLNNSNHDNTTVIHGNQLNRIISYDKQNDLKLQNFSHKINYQNAKMKVLQSQQNFSLLTNSSYNEKEDRTYVKVPGQEYKTAIKYLNNNSGDVDQFKQIVEDTRQENSVNVKSIINTKLNKVDKKIEESRKFTLLKQIENNSHITNERTNSHRAALEGFEHKLIDNDKNQVIDIDKMNPANAIKDIKIIKQENVSGSTDNSISFYKQENIAVKEKHKESQLAAKIKGIVKNKHIYRAKNYFNNTNLENILYEKDTDISRSLQFEKSLKRDPKAEDNNL